MIDTHSHIYGPEFDEDRADVVLRAQQAGVDHILLPNINEETIPQMLDLCRAYPGYCHPMMGLHPEDVKGDYQEVLGRMEALLDAEAHPYVAVGEVGLDFYWDLTFMPEQMDAFARQVAWGARYSLPLVIHSRNAHRILCDIMEKYRGAHLTGVFHCFGGTQAEAEELLTFEGFCLGIGGVSTFKKSTLPEVLRHVPLDRVLLETDSPYLAPVPHRGGRNESAYVACVCERLAQVYGVSPEEVDRITTENAKRVFPRIA